MGVRGDERKKAGGCLAREFQFPHCFMTQCYRDFELRGLQTGLKKSISRTLHRISAIRNRRGVIIGLTCRVGRAISGSAVLLRDLVQDGGSLLLIGPPGGGKTTMIRMNYITMQLAIDLVVLIEVVENHMPQVIVIDEIGTKLEALAARKIARRGIQLVATAHGVTIENLIMNPSLEMFVGGIQSVTLGDEEASRQGVQKTVQERKGPATLVVGWR
ncbi:hypothetical protein PS2_030657 [Malus domestica]